MKKKILITGGAGFIGYHLAKKLANDDYNVTILDNFQRGVKDEFLINLNQKNNVKIINVDLCNEINIKEIGLDYDLIFHFAAIIGVQNVLKVPYEVLTKNIVMLINMINFAKHQKALRRFVFTSTSEVYSGTLKYFGMKIPTPEYTPLTVNDLKHPRTSYMLSKIYGEAILRQSKIPFTIVRPHNIYGPRMGMSHVIPELLNKARKLNDGENLEVFSVNHKRTFCYIDDAINMIKLLSESDGAINEEFNVGNEYPEITIKELAENIINIVGKKLIITPLEDTVNSPKRRCPDMKKTTDCINYKGKISLQEGVKKTYEWYKKNIFLGNKVCEK